MTLSGIVKQGTDCCQSTQCTNDLIISAGVITDLSRSFHISTVQNSQYLTSPCNLPMTTPPHLRAP